MGANFLSDAATVNLNIADERWPVVFGDGALAV